MRDDGGPEAGAEVRQGLVDALRAAGCVFAEEEADELLEASAGREPGWWEAALARRVAGAPLEHVVGHVRFAGTLLSVGPGVFVPRRRTEVLAELARDHLPRAGLLVDLCCGVGAVAAVVARARPDVHVVAADIDPVATAYAEENLVGLGSAARSVEVVTGDLYAPLSRGLIGRVDVLAVNAPYVPSAEIAHMPREARDFEPMAALDGGVDGARIHARVVADAAPWLRPGGALMIETAAEAGDHLAAHCMRGGLEARVHSDHARGATVVVATARYDSLL